MRGLEAESQVEGVGTPGFFLEVGRGRGREGE